MEQKIWCLSKQRGGKLLVNKVVAGDSYCGQRIPIKSEDKKELHDLVYNKHNRQLQHGDIALVVDKRVEPELYNDLVKFIARKLYKVKREQPELYNPIQNEKIPCYFNGCCKLLRSSSKDVIWIALRKGSKKYPKDYTNLNRVCIDDATKTRFFNCADSRHYPIGRKHYIDLSDGLVFKQWSELMDKEYEEQKAKYKEEK